MANGLKFQVSAERAEGTATAVATQKIAVKKSFSKRLAIPLDFDFFKHLVYPYGLKEDLIVRLKLNSSEKMILCGRDNTSASSFQKFLKNVM